MTSAGWSDDARVLIRVVQLRLVPPERLGARGQRRNSDEGIRLRGTVELDCREPRRRATCDKLAGRIVAGEGLEILPLFQRRLSLGGR